MTPRYTSAVMALTGGEARAVLIVDTQLANNRLVEVLKANDVD